LRAAEVELHLKEHRLKLTRRLFDVSQASLIDLNASEAEFLQEQARYADVEVSLQGANRELTRLTGMNWDAEINNRKKTKICSFQVKKLIEKHLEVPLTNEVDAHPEISVLKLKLSVAQLEVAKRFSDHYPTLNLIASLNNGQSASELTIGRQIKTSVLGLQFNLPIFSGGGISAGVREAMALQQKAEVELENARFFVINDRIKTKGLFNNSLLKLTGDIKAYETAELNLQLESRRYDAKLVSEIDLLSARSKFEYASAKLSGSTLMAISNYSKLRLTYGDLSKDVLGDFSQVLDSCMTG
jgi:outer membrane protein TolC